MSREPPTPPPSPPGRRLAWWFTGLSTHARLTGLAVTGAAVLAITVGLTSLAWSSTPPPPTRWQGLVPSPPTSTPPVTETDPHAPPPPARAVPAERSPTPSLPPPPRPTAPDNSGGDEGGDDEFVTWAIMDLHTGAITGSPTLAQTSTTASMIKAWLVADYLRLHGDPGPQRRAEFSLIIRDSDNVHTQTLFEELGQEESIHRLIRLCGLTDSSAIPQRWSNTLLSGRDTARMGACLANGTAAGEEWTEWLMEEMRLVRGLGDFGIRHALPPGARGGVAIKNGWVIRSDVGEYHVNCLAIGNGWSMGVLTRYPAHLGYEHGAEICRRLAAEHLPLT